MTFLKIILIALVSLYIIGGLGAYFLQEHLIFLPEQLPADYTYDFEQPFDELFLEMQDGAQINALHFKQDSSRGLILYFHGNAGSLARWGDVVEPFVDRGFEVLIVDYRGYGKSTGIRSKELLLSDSENIYEYARGLTEESDIIVFGRSLGTSFASHLGGKYNPKLVVLETPFYSLSDVANNVIPIYPQSLLLRFNFKNYQSLKTASSPIRIFHGTEDEVVPYKSGKKLFDSLIEKDIEFFTIQNGYHNNLALFEEYWEHMDSVLLP